MNHKILEPARHFARSFTKLVEKLLYGINAQQTLSYSNSATETIEKGGTSKLTIKTPERRQ